MARAAARTASRVGSLARASRMVRAYGGAVGTVIEPRPMAGRSVRASAASPRAPVRHAVRGFNFTRLLIASAMASSRPLAACW